MNVSIVERPTVRTVACRHVGPYNQISEAFARLGQAAGPAGLFMRGVEMIAVYYDDPAVTAPDELRSDAAVSVSADATIPPPLTELVVPGGTFAMAVHRGPYETIGQTWAQLGAWMTNNGKSRGPGLTYEIYRNTPGGAAPEDLITEIYIPVVK